MNWILMNLLVLWICWVEKDVGWVVVASVVGAVVVWMVQTCELSPVHDTPPFSGAGAVQVLVCLPLLHALHAVQPPFTTEKKSFYFVWE